MSNNLCNSCKTYNKEDCLIFKGHIKDGTRVDACFHYEPYDREEIERLEKESSKLKSCISSLIYVIEDDEILTELELKEICREARELVFGKADEG